LTFASAGNRGDVDVDAIATYGPCNFDWDCVRAESDVWIPCENDAVICVGGLAENSAVKSSGSSFGSQQRFANNLSIDNEGSNNTVDIYGPYSVWVGPDPEKNFVHRINGTSFSSPFVAGVTALIYAANPSLSAARVERILLETAHRTPNLAGNIGGLRVNALGAIQSILGRPPSVALTHNSLTPGQARSGRTIEINAAVADPDGASGCCTRTWNPQPTGPQSTTSKGIFQFDTAGEKTITMTARDSSGNSTTSSITIIVTDDPPDQFDIVRSNDSIATATLLPRQSNTGYGTYDVNFHTMSDSDFYRFDVSGVEGPSGQAGSTYFSVSAYGEVQNSLHVYDLFGNELNLEPSDLPNGRFIVEVRNVNRTKGRYVFTAALNYRIDLRNFNFPRPVEIKNIFPVDPNALADKNIWTGGDRFHVFKGGYTKLSNAFLKGKGLSLDLLDETGTVVAKSIPDKDIKNPGLTVPIIDLNPNKTYVLNVYGQQDLKPTSPIPYTLEFGNLN
jgi:hypothetical protein